MEVWKTMKKKLSTETFSLLKNISDLKVNSDKTAVTFAVQMTDIKNNTYYNDLYWSDGKKVKKLMTFKKYGLNTWKNKDTLLIQTEKGKEDKKKHETSHSVFYTYNIKEKATTPAFTLPVSVSSIQYLDNNNLYAEARLNPNTLGLLDKKANREVILEKNQSSDYIEIDTLPFYNDRIGYKEGNQVRPLVYDVKKKTLKLVVSDDFECRGSYVDKGTKSVYFWGEHLINKSDNKSNCLYRYSVGDEKAECIFKGDTDIVTIKIAQDKVWVFANDFQPYGRTQIPRLYQLEKKKLSLVTSFDWDIVHYFGHHEFPRGTLTMIGDYGYSSSVYNLEGKDFVKAFDFPGKLKLLVTLKDQYIVIAEEYNIPTEIYTVSLDGSTFQPLTSFNKVLLDEYQANPAQYYSYQSDGNTLDGWIIYPSNFNKNKKYPAILDIHGGPRGAYGPYYNHGFQWLSQQGYFVFFTNPRGSSQKGNDFAELRGLFGTIDYDDFTAFVDTTLELHPNIDEAALAVTGISYGGYMTNWMISQTNRFKTAISENGICNWISMSGTSDIHNITVDFMGADPISEVDKLWEQSPLKYVKNVKTPTLFIHSDTDFRCPVEQTYQYYTYLKVQGVKTKFLMIKNEWHGVSVTGKPNKRIKRYEVIESWFKENLKK